MRISRVTALPPIDENLQQAVSRKAWRALKQLPRSTPTPTEQLFPHAPAAAVDLVQELLRFLPLERITAKQSVQHPFVRASQECAGVSTQDLATHADFEYEERGGLALSEYAALVRREAEAAAPTEC